MVTLDNNNNKKNLDDCIYLHGVSISSYLSLTTLVIYILLYMCYIYGLYIVNYKLETIYVYALTRNFRAPISKNIWSTPNGSAVTLKSI